MPLIASGAGGYGSIGGLGKGGGLQARPAVGNSKMMPAQSIASIRSVAKQHIDNFISNGRMINKGASGNSRVNIKA
ncbi:MAG: hypothetical protein HQK86_12640 [Nitrospinae bacterium]|nr:hypothetical protein [Nitrospinota bacterium]MBF0634752.1 hypothetical protein [Nitrospinota bacterium]